MKFYLKSEEFLKVFPKTFLCAKADLFEEEVSPFTFLLRVHFFLLLTFFIPSFFPSFL